MPWYPTMRLIRRNGLHDYQEVIESVKMIMRNWMAGAIYL